MMEIVTILKSLDLSNLFHNSLFNKRIDYLLPYTLNQLVFIKQNVSKISAYISFAKKQIITKKHKHHNVCPAEAYFRLYKSTVSFFILLSIHGLSIDIKKQQYTKKRFQL